MDDAAKPEEVPSDDRVTGKFPVVAVGASAGGLDAFKRFLESMPSDRGIAWVLVQHLDPSHESLMANLLSKCTAMPVVQVDREMPLSQDHVYIIPPNKFLRIADGRLYLDEPVKQRGVRMPVDYLFRSLAEARGAQAICAVLTGTGSDGSLGVREVKAAGGLTIAQNPEGAEYDGMPRAATSTGMVDLVLDIEDMADAIVSYIDHPYANGERLEHDLDRSDPDNFRSIIQLLRAHTEYDFRSYKKGTLSRRIQRRIGLGNFGSTGEYVQALRKDPEEVRALFKDLLISVTRFFRDEESWEVLRRDAIAPLVRSKSANEPIRVWVPGCATGEEAYTLGMLLLEEMEKQQKSLNIQIFATDIDDDAIAVARAGKYPGSIAADISARRLERHFHEDGDGYRVSKRLREISVFAVQNLIGDPPFSGLDIVACRNVMIYLESDIQRRMMELFHFALRENGILYLGSSESIGRFANLFADVSAPNRIYRRIASARRTKSVFPVASLGRDPSEANVHDRRAPKSLDDSAMSSTLVDQAMNILVDRFAPACVFVNRRNEVQFFSGPVRNYLDIPRGEPTVDLVPMTLPGLRHKLRGLLAKASAGKERQEDVARGVERDGIKLDVLLRVEPVAMGRTSESVLLVSFRDIDDTVAPKERVVAPLTEDEQHQLTQLEYELQATREDLQSTIEELETSNEELKASNEEVMSMNEELQSTNEELETSREELQSLNEELSTVNNQLEDKVDELEAANNDLTNLLTSTNLATVFLDQDLRIRRYTPATEQVLNIIDGDIGRKMSDLAPRVKDPNLVEDAKAVLETLTPRERQVQNGGEHWYMRQILPYRTADNKIEGVVITFSDVTGLRAATDRLETRIGQQAGLAELGRLALDSETAEQELLDRAVELVARRCNVEFAKVLKCGAANEELLLVAGEGWQQGLVGRATVPAGPYSQAGFTLQSSAPVIVENLAEDRRISGPQLLLDHAVVSGMSVIIGPPDSPWGVLGAHTARRRDFNVDDTHFLQNVANLLWQSIERRQVEHDLEEERRELVQTADTIEIWLARVDRDFVFRFANRAYAAGIGLDPSGVIDRPVREVIGEARFHTARPYLERALGGESDVAESELEVDGEIRQKLTHYAPRLDRNGQCDGVYVAVTDITGQKHSERRVSEARERLQLALDAAEMGTWEWYPERGTIWWDERERQLFGVGRDTAEVAEEVFFETLHPEDVDRMKDAATEILEGDRDFEEEFRIIRPDGEVRWMFGKGKRVDVDGQARIVGLNFDITKEKREEERKSLLLSELDHRVRNVLANVLAIAGQSRSENASVDSFLEAFFGRVNALARTQTLLSRSGWQGVRLEDAIREELAPYENGANVIVEGPEVTLRPGAAQLCAMAIHELATNAAKYGALSTERGEVCVTWEIRNTARDRRELIADWKERNGPAVSVPERTGFGSLVLTEMLSYELDGEVDLRFEPQGLECRMRFALDRVGGPGLGNFSLAFSDARELPPPSTDVSGLRVLVVEDGAALAREMTGALTGAGCQVIGPYATAEEGLAAARERQIDIGIININIDGETRSATLILEVLRARRIPVIGLTGYSDPSMVEPDFADVPRLMKPFDSQAVVDMIRRVMF